MSTSLRSLDIHTNQLKDQIFYFNDASIKPHYLNLRIKNLKHLPACFDYKSIVQLSIRSEKLKSVRADLLNNSTLRDLKIEAPNLETTLILQDTPQLAYLTLSTSKPLDLSLSILSSILDTLVIYSPKTTLPDLTPAVGLKTLRITGLEGYLDNGINNCVQLNSLTILQSELTGLSLNINKIKSLTSVIINASLDHIPSAIPRPKQPDKTQFVSQQNKEYQCRLVPIKQIEVT